MSLPLEATYGMRITQTFRGGERSLVIDNTGQISVSHNEQSEKKLPGFLHTHTLRDHTLYLYQPQTFMQRMLRRKPDPFESTSIRLNSVIPTAEVLIPLRDRLVSGTVDTTDTATYILPNQRLHIEIFRRQEDIDA